MKILLIRHGRTKGNMEHRYVGSTDEALLLESEVWIKENRERYPKPDQLFVSPLQRCVRTAELLYPEAEMQIEPELRECEFGAFEYKNYIELQGNADYQAWIDGGGVSGFPGGESRAEFTARCSRAFAECCSKAERKADMLLGFVVHGGTIMALLDQFSEPHKEYFSWQVKNTEGFLCEFLMDGDQIRLTNIQKVPF